MIDDPVVPHLAGSAGHRSRRAGGQLPPHWRKLLLIAHVATTVGWFGTVTGALVLGIAGYLATDPAAHRVPYQALNIFDLSLMRPIGVLVFLTSLPLGLWTRWGLLGHYWVAAKLWLTITVVTFAILFQSQWIHAAGERIAHGATRVGEPLETRLVLGPVLILLLLAPQIVLSVLKPWGRTRRGRRAQAQARTSPTSR